MQTFLPYSSFVASMAALDASRLGNQVYREGMTLLRGKWSNHPAAIMWRGYEPALAQYLWCGVNELFRRGRNYYGRDWCQELARHIVDNPPMPPWLGDPDFHASHRSNLLRKNPEWYGRFGWTEPPTLEYIWPTN